jgi:acetyl esterase/lipase
MKIRGIKNTFFATLALLIFSFNAPAQEPPASSAWATDVGSRYWVQPDIVYQGANNQQLKLDVWYQHDVKTPSPTLVYIHGGGWIFGTKEGSVLQFLPFLEKGWTIVNVEYRMASSSPAPAAVEDTRCALRWVYRNAQQWRFDTSKIVLMGHSAGGHLSLMTGILPEASGLDNQCYGTEKLGVAAIINWYGITDVNDLTKGSNLKNYAVMWMGSQPNAEEIARRVSPLTYVRASLPPILTIHGDKDDVVPYAHATRLRDALEKVKSPNQLLTIKDGGHGGFSANDYAKSYETIWAFLRQNKIIQ